MSYNGSGTFNINTSGQPVVTGTVISSTAFNALTADLATGLSTAITKDGQTAATARIPFAQGISSTLVTDSTSTTTGSIITAGGVGVAKALFVGTTANVAGAVTLQSTLAVGGVATYSAQPIFSSLTASSAVATDASKGLVSVTNTGTGNNVLSTSPTLVTPVLGAASATSVTVAAGAVGTPSITTTGDTNTGIFFPAADTIAFAEGGVEAARLDSAGNMGLGVTPSAWGSNNRTIDMYGIGSFSSFSNGAGGYELDVGLNAYNSASGWRYKVSSYAVALYQQAAGSHIWYNAAAGTAGNAISFTQALTLNTNGALALQGASTSATGVGITFPATQSASSDANTLDDYEEGTWTPTDASGASLSLTVTAARYIKIGSSVTVIAIFSYPVTASASGGNVGGLPFANNLDNSTGSILSSNANAQKMIISGTSTSGVFFFPVNSTTQSTNVALSNTTIYMSITYRTT
jgi:hypothetical protein